MDLRLQIITFAPHISAAFAVATNVTGEVNIKSPFFKPRDIYIKCNAEKLLKLQTIEFFTLNSFDILSSKALITFPPVKN